MLIKQLLCKVYTRKAVFECRRRKTKHFKNENHFSKININ